MPRQQLFSVLLAVCLLVLAESALSGSVTKSPTDDHTMSKSVSVNGALSRSRTSSVSFSDEATATKSPSSELTASRSPTLSNTSNASGTGGGVVSPTPASTTTVTTTTTSATTTTATAAPPATTAGPSGTATSVTSSAPPGPTAAGSTTATAAPPATTAGPSGTATSVTSSAPPGPTTAGAAATTAAPPGLTTAGPTATTGTAAPVPPSSHAARVRTGTRTISVPATPPPPTRIVIVAAAAADDGLAAFTSVPVISAIVGVVALVAFTVAAVVLGPRLREAWRKRRRTGDGPDELVAPLQDRTNQYRWYEDAEAVAQDLERRGDDVRRLDPKESLLSVPSVPSASGSVAGGAAFATIPCTFDVPRSASNCNPLTDFLGGNDGGSPPKREPRQFDGGAPPPSKVDMQRPAVDSSIDDSDL